PPPDPEAFERAVLSVGSYDWVVFTSANGVRCTAQVLEQQARDARIFGSARIAVIGEKTGEALAALGLRADLVASEYVAESLREELLAATKAGDRVLLLRARVARETLPEALARAGRAVDVAAAYETKAVSGSDLAALREALRGQVDVVLFTSSSM